MSTSLRAVEGLGALVAGHVFFSGVGMANASLARPPVRPATARVSSSRVEQIKLAVKSMYSGAGADPTKVRAELFLPPAAVAFLEATSVG